MVVKMKNRTVLLLLVFLLTFGLIFSGCGKNPKNEEQPASSYPQIETKTITTLGFQLDAPKAGEEIAVLHTSKGDVKIRLFPEYAPKAVENFKGLINSGYYNGVTFHRVMNNFMIQSGDPTGSGGESFFGKPFEDEFSPDLINLRGALSMDNSDLNTNGSQFFINTKKPTGTTAEKLRTAAEKAKRDYIDNYAANLESYKSTYDTNSEISGHYGSFKNYFESAYTLTPDVDMVPDKVFELYAQYGGNSHLDGAYRLTGGHTVFGQVFEGIAVADAIGGVETDGYNKPLEDITINSAEIAVYQ